jgi:hypothetical protein
MTILPLELARVDFQEHQLSPRLLIFDQHYLYFDCRDGEMDEVMEYEPLGRQTGLYSKPGVLIQTLHSDTSTIIQGGTKLLATRILVGTQSKVIGCQLLLGLLKNGKT